MIFSNNASVSFTVTVNNMSENNQQQQQQQQQQQSSYGPLSETTRVSRYQKEHSPTHHPDHHPSLSASSIYYDP